MAMLVVILLVFLHVDCSSQLPTKHPSHGVVDMVNEFGPFIGIVMAYQAEADAIVSSGEFIPRSDVPWLDLYGRRFHIGSIRGVDVIYVMSGQRRLNAGITVQTLLNIFDVKGIIHYGTAGSANDTLSFGDVSVPRFVAFTGSWTWTKFNSEIEELPTLKFGEFNLPEEGKNLLSKVEFKPEEFYSVGKPMEEVFWLDMGGPWFELATQLQNLKLQQCVNKTYCLPETPKVVFGLKGSTADIFVDNAAYRKFLFNEFKVSTVDEESAAVATTAMSPGVPVIVFRGVSDLAGGGSKWSSTSLSSLAAANSLTVALEFIGLIGKDKLLISLL